MIARRFEGKSALVTGGNSGMGLAVAHALVREGARVVFSGRERDTLEQAARELGSMARGVRADVSRMDDLDRLVAAAADFGGGRIDVLFANAGSALFRPMTETTEADWDAVMDVNLKGVYFTVQKALPLMGDGGAIVLNASVAAAKGNPVGSLYGASKAGVRSLGRTFAAEFIGRGIRVNVVSPGPIETPLFERDGLLAGTPVPSLKAAWAERNPMKRFGTPEEVAAAVLFLASEEASYITGAELLVDGGVGSL